VSGDGSPKDVIDMVSYYERLRADVVSSLGQAMKVVGVVLFLRHGMKAWSLACSSLTPGSESATVPARLNEGRCSWESQQEITNILATMILSREMEGFQ